ncbi:hypothetical protein, partial [Arsenicibacter rosenii]|uniref:hypothetical protein n=1 Tax=Arsenicibacter rosenii TaxID=1750698 RepID=UPI0015A71834
KALEELSKLEEENHIARIASEEGRDIAKLQAARDREAEAIMKGLQAQSVKDKQLTALNEKLEQDIAGVHTKYSEKKKKEDEEAAQKRLEVLRNVARQEQEAEMALLDWKELQARGNNQKLAQLAKERANTILLFTINGLKEEEAAEKAKATREISDKDLLAQTLSGIEKKYLNERKAAVAANAADLAKIEADLQQKKKELWSNAGSAFGALLKGDL